MATWKYLKGEAKDFEGAPDWATLRVKHGSDYDEHFIASMDECKYQSIGKMVGIPVKFSLEYWDIIAQRELVTSVNDDRLAQDVAAVKTLEMSGYTYHGGELWKPPLGKAPDYINGDNVNHPSHYTQGGIECIDAIKAATVGKTGIEAVCVANVVKYLWRYEQKGGIESVKKARWYLERLITELSEGE